MKLNRIVAALALATAAPVAFAAPSFNYQWTYQHTGTAASQAQGSEILSFDSLNRRLWVVGTDANITTPVGRSGVDVLSLSGALVTSIDLRDASVGGVNSVAIASGQAAVAITGAVKTNPGVVKFYDATSFATQATVTVGANPDSVAYTPDGSKLLVANEGEPINYTSGTDPVGSVSIIKSSDFSVSTADFSSFNSQAAALRAAGVRLNGPGASVAQDLEPEYITVSKDGRTAAVTLQEANSVAFVDIDTATVTSVKALGLKDHSLAGNGLDVSDRDGSGNAIRNGQIQNWNVKGVYMPDGIASFTQGGQQFYVTANEGDSREDWQTGLDEVRIGATNGGSNANIDSALNTALVAAHGADYRSNNDKLQRLNVLKTGDTDGDGDLDELQVLGARSFSILDANGTMLFDSGDKIEQIIKANYMPSTSCTLTTANCLWDDTRSDNKGPEPESAVVGQVGSDTLLFLGLERSNAIMVWNLNDRTAPSFVEMLFHNGDVGPEGMSFFTDGGYGYLAVSSEVSGSTSLYRTAAPVPVPAAAWLLGSAIGAMGLARRRKAAVAA